MSSAIDGKSIIKRLKKIDHDKRRTTLYLSEELYEAFKKRCEDNSVSASEAMEELMRAFLKTTN